jgi:hypothetical protein
VTFNVHAVREPDTGRTAIVDILKLANGEIVEHRDDRQDLPEKGQPSRTGRSRADFGLPSLLERYFHGADTGAFGSGAATGRLRDAITSRAPRARITNAMTTRMNTRIRFDPPP